MRSEVVPRKGIPHHIDPITKQPKYVDPAHRQCVPCFKAASFTPKNKKDKYNGRTHNCITTVKQNSGDIFAYPHPQILTGFKAPNAYGRTPLFDGTTTQAYFTHKVRKVGEEVDLGAKKLCPFDLMANRNQARAITHNDVGMSCFDRRNASYIRLTTGNPKDMKTPLTTHQRFHVLPKNSIGWNNPGIFAGNLSFLVCVNENVDQRLSPWSEPKFVSDVDTEDTPEELGLP